MGGKPLGRNLAAPAAQMDIVMEIKTSGFRIGPEGLRHVGEGDFVAAGEMGKAGLRKKEASDLSELVKFTDFLDFFPLRLMAGLGSFHEESSACRVEYSALSTVTQVVFSFIFKIIVQEALLARLEKVLRPFSGRDMLNYALRKGLRLCGQTA